MNVSVGSSAGTSSGVERESRKRKKKPGQVRRDQQRRAVFLERRRQAAELARTNEIREEQVEKSTDVKQARAGETSSGVGVEAGQANETRTVSVATNQANSARTGASDSDESNTENGANATNIVEEDIMQIDGNVSLSDITEEEDEEEKIKPPKMRTLSLRMNSKDIQKEELVKRLKKNDILETDYYFSTHDGYFLGWSGPLDRHVRVYGITVKDFEKTWPKLEKIRNTWESLLNLEVHRE